MSATSFHSLPGMQGALQQIFSSLSLLKICTCMSHTTCRCLSPSFKGPKAHSMSCNARSVLRKSQEANVIVLNASPSCMLLVAASCHRIAGCHLVLPRPSQFDSSPSNGSCRGALEVFAQIWYLKYSFPDVTHDTNHSRIMPGCAIPPLNIAAIPACRSFMYSMLLLYLKEPAKGMKGCGSMLHDIMIGSKGRLSDPTDSQTKSKTDVQTNS